MSYTPDALLTFFHSVPRYDQNLRPAPNAFDASLSPTSPYLVGVYMQAGGFVALGAIVLLLFTVLLAGARLCCRSAKPATSCCCCCRRVSYCLISLVSCALVSGAMYIFSTWRSGITASVSSLRAFSGVLGAAAGAVSGPLAASMTALSADAGALVAACSANSCDASVPGLLAGVTEVQTQAQSTLGTVTDLGATLTSAAASTLRSLGLAADSSFSLDNIAGAVDKWAWVTLGVLAGWLLIHLTTLSPTRGSACLFRASTAVTLLVGVALPALAGGLYAVTLVGSDVCVAPADSITRLLNATAGVDPLAANTFAYYASCASAGGGGVGGGDASSRVAGASAALGSATGRVAELNATLLAAQGAFPALATALLPILGSITGDIAASNATIAALAGSTLACAPVSGIYFALLGALCGQAVRGVALSFIPLAAASIAMLLLLSYAVALCANHPGDSAPGGDASAEEELLMSPAWGASAGGGRGAVGEWGASGASGKNLGYGATSRYERRAY